MIKLLAILLIVDSTVLAVPMSSPCSNALNACVDLVNAQDKEISDLRAGVNALAAKTEKIEESSYEHPPFWVYIVLGVAGGFVLGKKL